MGTRDIHRSLIANPHGGATMQQSRHRRQLLAVVAVTAMVGLGATVLPQWATATTPHPRALGVGACQHNAASFVASRAVASLCADL